jgi:hypothetical protein
MHLKNSTSSKTHMSHIEVKWLSDIGIHSTPAAVALRMNDLQKHCLNYSPWPAYPFQPQVQVSIAYNSEFIFLQYQVTEQSIKAAHGTINAPVYEDSCVEFFILFDDEGYYNLEMNCIGTCLAEFGKNQLNRQLLPKELIETIKYQSVISKKSPHEFQWELTLSIPLYLFCYHHPITLKGKNCKANFYKCGDKLPQPHFVSWTYIDAPYPNFHLPSFFGTLTFE